MEPTKTCATCVNRTADPAACFGCFELGGTFTNYKPAAKVDRVDYVEIIDDVMGPDTPASRAAVEMAARKLGVSHVLYTPTVERSIYADLEQENPKTRFGMAKPPIGLIPGVALVHMADGFRDGCEKYGPANWRDKAVPTSIYTSACMRHLLAWIDGEETAPDSGVHHLGHAMSCLAIILDAQAQGTLNDDRPTAGRTSQLIAQKTRPQI